MSSNTMSSNTPVELFVADSERWPAADGKQMAGEKADNLCFLSKNGINVPAWIAVTKHAHRSFMNQLNGNLSDTLNAIDYNHVSSIAKCGREIRTLIESTPFPEQTKAILELEISKFTNDSSWYAVRSSAVGEDSAANSFAGQMDSFLFVKGTAGILDSIKKCWASAYTDRALAYRNHAALDSNSVEMGVIVQEMIDGDVSGVAFTVNPIKNSFNEIFISATFGAGEGIVSGELDTDQFIVDKKALVLKSTETVFKENKLVFDSEKGTGTILKPVPEEKRDAACLDQKTLEDMAGTFKTIETLYDFPQDIEWTVTNGNVHILQARPVTTITKTQYIEETGVETIWDNSNIVESYSGVTSPLTFSFIRHAYYMVYLQFCQVLRVPEKVITDEDNNLRNMLGSLNGQVYYNLKNWYRLVSHLPGYNYNKAFMEQMMGVAEEAKFDAPAEKRVSVIKKYLVELPRLLLAGGSLFFQFLTMSPRVTVFMKRVSTYYEKYRRFDFDSVSAHTLHDIYQELEKEVLMHWKAPIVNDFLIMICYGILKNLTAAWNLDEKGTLANDLLCGQGDVESTLPMKMLLSISEDIKADNDLTRQFSSLTQTELKERYINEDEKRLSHGEKKIRKRLLEYLDEYGFRCMNELKLEEPSLKEKPDFIFMMLKNYLNASQGNTGIDETAIRKKAENHVKRTLKKQYVLKIIPRNFVFNRILSFSKKGVSFREYQRFARTKMFGLVRNIFSAMGRKFHDLDIITEPNDIFYLTTEEIFAFTEGHAVSKNLKGIISLRKEEYSGYSEDLDQRIYTRGIVLRNVLSADPGKTVVVTEDGVYKGTSCCPGIVIGKVKVILSPNDDMSLNDEILVAGKTDPGWVPLYPAARGVLIERGSILSHSSIVAREMGLPAIVGISGITKILKTGDVVEMDGAAGTVKIISQSAGVGES